MAIHWDWNRKQGEVFIKEDGKTYKCNLYLGNCLLVAIHEYKDANTGKDMYNIVAWVNDLKHLKNCLGLTNGWNDNIFKSWKKVRINTYWWENNSHLKRYDVSMIQALTQAGIKVEFYRKIEFCHKEVK